MNSSVATRVLAAGIGLTALVLGGCADIYPDVVVVNRTDALLVLRDISFQGCFWPAALSYGESTSPQACLPGTGRVHFKKLDAGRYCCTQPKDGTLDGVCLSDSGGAAVSGEPGQTQEVPLWFSYQTSLEHRVDYGGFERIEVRLDDLEQDFSTTSPYGH